jgi:branched-chain amino acid transport system permease protein
MDFIVVQILTGLANASALFLVASGLSIIFGVTRVVNFAHGSFYMLGAYIAYSAMAVLPGFVGFWASILLTGLAVGLIGLVVELGVLRPIYKSPELFQLVATFGVILVIQDLTLLIWGPENLIGPRAPGFEGVVQIGEQLMPAYDLVLILLSFLVLGGLWFLFNRTRAGILVRAATQDREMVGALGINQSWLFSGVFFLGSALAGIGGAAQLPKGGAELLMDFSILAPVFVVVVIGGMGSIPGAFVAALIISELNVFGVQLLPQSTLVLMFLVMAVVLIFRPWGLFGRPELVGGQGASGPPEAPLRAFSGQLWLLLAVTVIALMVVPLFGETFIQVLLADVIIACLFATSLHFILGLGGLVSFGHAATFGSGAYAAALMVQYADSSMELAILLAPLAAGMVALVIGWFCVRLSGVYFAMLTLAFAQVVWSIAFQWGDVTGGDDGMLGIWPSAWASTTTAYYYLVLTIGVSGIATLLFMAYTPFGYALRGSRDSALRSEAIGINVRLVQWSAFVFAGFMSGLAGALFVFAKGSIFPTELEIARSFDALIIVFLGGVQSLFGPLVGGVAFTLLQDALSRFEYWRLCLGLLIIAIVILFPNGLVGAVHWIAARLGQSPDADEAEALEKETAA